MIRGSTSAIKHPMAHYPVVKTYLDSVIKYRKKSKLFLNISIKEKTNGYLKQDQGTESTAL